MTKLQQKRQEVGLSQGRLAVAAGVKVRVLQNYEQGARNLDGANIATLARLAIALNCTIPDILEDEETSRLVYEAMKKPRR